MDKWSFGVAMTLIGVSGTFLTLGVLVLLTNVLKKIFPEQE